MDSIENLRCKEERPHNDVSYTVTLSADGIEKISVYPEEYLERQHKAHQQFSGDEDPRTSSNNSTLEKFKWTNESIKLLLHVRFEMDSEFEAPKCKKNKLWMEVAKQMAELGQFAVNWEECYTKYRNLLQTYKHNREKRTLKSGESGITWEYYNIFDNALGCKASTYPSSEYNMEQEVNEPPNKKLKRSVNKKDKSKEILSFPEYLFMKNQREENSFQIKKQLKEREIDAINNLAEAIRETANK